MKYLRSLHFLRKLRSRFFCMIVPEDHGDSRQKSRSTFGANVDRISAWCSTPCCYDAVRSHYGAFWLRGGRNLHGFLPYPDLIRLAFIRQVSHLLHPACLLGRPAPRDPAHIEPAHLRASASAGLKPPEHKHRLALNRQFRFQPRNDHM